MRCLIALLQSFRCLSSGAFECFRIRNESLFESSFPHRPVKASVACSVTLRKLSALGIRDEVCGLNSKHTRSPEHHCV
ncbi:hypothetical protein PHSY_001650 [Pseudozyma hubeiensis SY62]|uniref:Uncharacterized protein n=1 Tax=Pseudozyma hubeiensis (strain SY62) TaxID=1305764 RepID=R9NZA3_PSEHS|nr:hypothetical protein PHSY_001650 [Pseudozyma hubeiensis SY62]GAC94081.1 hypothetical protein PHSY_001650 [Pseudozyma hubeiensis SY62]